VEPLVRASGYLGEPARRLDPDARSRLLALVGWRRVLVDPRASEVRLRGGARLDLGGIAKGYAADLALAALRRAGARAGYVDLGSSSIGAFGGAIAVDLRDPEDPQGAPLGTLRLDEAFLGASGGDQRGTHILDPRSGRPADRATSVTVVARTGVEADALSTAVYVLGPRDGMQLLRRRGAEGLVNWREDGRRRTRATPGFPGAVAAVSDPASARR
jgi:thiamine biosynthesis lipoprotein